MENIILAAVGLATLAYVAHAVRRGLQGRSVCSCDSADSCRRADGGCRSLAKKPPADDGRTTQRQN